MIDSSGWINSSNKDLLDCNETANTRFLHGFVGV